MWKRINLKGKKEKMKMKKDQSWRVSDERTYLTLQYLIIETARLCGKAHVTGLHVTDLAIN